MSLVIPSWVKIALLIVGIIVFVSMIVFVYLLIAGADESRRKDKESDENRGKQGGGHGEDS